MAERPQLQTVSFTKNAYIFVEGKEADCFFIILKGRARIFREVEIEGEEQKILKEGDFLGVVPVMSGHSHIETAQALTEITLIKVLRKQFDGIVQYNAPVAMKVLTQFSVHTRFLNETMEKATHVKVSEEDTSILFNAGEFYEQHERLSDACYVYHKFIERFPRDSLSSRATERLNALVRYDTTAKLNVKTSSRGYAKGFFIFAEGEEGKELFLLLKGTVRITKIAGGEERILALLKPGDIFGEMAILESKPRSANAIAAEDCAVMAMDMEELCASAAIKPQTLEKLTCMLSERIWFLYKQLNNAAISDPIGRMFNTLAMHLEKAKLNVSSKSAYLFDFSSSELAKMVGIPEADATHVVIEMMKNSSLRVQDGKLFTTDASEIWKQAELARGIQRRKTNAH
jgi:CRP-like cAMP-binding protein